MTGRIFLLDDGRNDCCSYKILYNTKIFWFSIERQVNKADLYALITLSKKSIETYKCVNAHTRLGGFASNRTLGVIHIETKNAEKVYQYAKDYAKDISKRNSWDFVDLTSRLD